MLYDVLLSSWSRKCHGIRTQAQASVPAPTENPKPEKKHLGRQTPRPQSDETLNPKLSPITPKPSTLNPRPPDTLHRGERRSAWDGFAACMTLGAKPRNATECLQRELYTYVHTYVHTYIHTYIRTYISMHACLYECIDVCLFVSLFVACVFD